MIHPAQEVAALQFQHVEDAVQQAQSLQDLCATDGLPDELRRKLVVLKDRVGVLRREAMERLDHEFGLMREHRWGKRKKELKDSFVKVVGVLTGEKSVLRKCLSKLHDSASKELPTLLLADLADWAQYFDEAVHDMTQEQPDAAVKLVGQFTTCFSEKFEAAKEAFRRAKEAHDPWLVHCWCISLPRCPCWKSGGVALGEMRVRNKLGWYDMK